MIQMTHKERQKFFDKVYKTETCWLWSGATCKGGYGNFRFRDKYYNSHKLSYLIHIGDTKGLCVLHECDIRRCVNPKHLFLGTQKKNIEDMYLKGRGTEGSKNGHSVLNENQVREIKIKLLLKVSLKDLADEYSVSTGCIGEIRKGNNWKHIEV